MRRIVFGLLFATLVYWSCTALGRGPAGPENVSGPDLAQVLANAQSGGATGAASAADKPAAPASATPTVAEAGTGAGGAATAPLSAAKVDAATPVADPEL